MRILFATLGLVAASALPAFAAPQIGEPLPAFTATTIDGEVISNESLAGAKVVLEWTNHQCPFVVKHYDSGNMQATQGATAEDGAVWVTIISSAPGKQGHVSAEKAAELTTSRNATPTHVVIDESGDLGRLFEAKVTPHMYIANADSELVYMGAIDSIKSAKISDIEKAENYVLSAFANLESGEAVATPTSNPYGCSIKY